MIPQAIDRYLKDHHLPYEHTIHARAIPAQRLAAAEHVSGHKVAKTVVVSIDGRLGLAVVDATHKVNLEALRRATGAAKVELVPEDLFADRFAPCEPGAEPPLGLFGLPIYVDADVASQPWIVMRGGTHEDALRIDTQIWMEREGARAVRGLALETM
jgi:Ala-tRNA(Pro) deacylase